MANIRVEQHISAPRAQVWDDLADVASHAEWMADAEAIEFAGDQRAGTGTRIDVRTRVGPFTLTDVMEFTSWEPPERMAVDHRGIVSGTGAFRLTETPSGTLFVWEEHLAFPRWLGGPVAAFFAKPVLRGIWRRNLRRLAARFE